MWAFGEKLISFGNEASMFLCLCGFFCFVFPFSFQDWIFRQLCETTTPLHTQLLPLIDVYITSILTPASKAHPEATNQPITEQEILNVFEGRRWVGEAYFVLTMYNVCNLCMDNGCVFVLSCTIMYQNISTDKF